MTALPNLVRWPVDALRKATLEPMQAMLGAHDEPHIYSEPAGDPGLIGPGSMSWELHSDMGLFAAAGLAAIVMEILHPSVMAGVHDMSNYQRDPLHRMRTTHGYVIVTTFGSTDAATKLIKRVHGMHARVEGTRPDGGHYRALDPNLIAWVHTMIPWAIMLACEKYRRPLSVAEKDRYLREQAVIGRMGGADRVPESVAELEEFVAAMRPQLAVNEQTTGFLEFVTGPREGPFTVTARQRATLRGALIEGMALMPEWARTLTGLEHPDAVHRLRHDLALRRNIALARFAYGTPVYRRLAEERAAADQVAAPPEVSRTPSRRRPATAHA